MESLIRIWRQLARLLLDGRFQAGLSSEMREHLEEKVEELAANGMPAEEARLEAKRQFGNTLLLREQSRDVWSFRWLETLLQDLRYGVRQLRRSPGFSAVAIVTLALGIAVNTTIFSVVSEILLRKPSVKDPDRLCAVSSKDSGSDLIRASAPDFKSWRQKNHVFENMAAALTGRSFTMTGKGDPEAVDGDYVTPNYFKVVGVFPVLGRPFLPSEGQAGNDHVVILSNALWKARFASDSKVIGKHTEINGEPYTIAGVMPPGTDMTLFTPRLWVPLVFSPEDLTPSARGNHYVNLVLGRLKPGVTVQEAQAEMSSIAQHLAQAYPKTNKGWGITVLTLQEYMIRSVHVRQAAEILVVAVGFVLLIACANIACLLVARSAGRAHEMAVRCAAGASRLRLVRQMLTESLLLGLAGGAAGLMMSVWGIDLLRAGLDFNFVGKQWAAGIHLDQATLLFTLAISFLTIVLFGLVPAVEASNTDPCGALTEGGRTGSISSHRRRARNVLVAGEIALALVLLAGAGTLMQQLPWELTDSRGFSPTHVLDMDIDLNGPRYKKPAAQVAFFQQLTRKLLNLPGVESAGATMGLPLAGSWSTSFKIAGQRQWSKSEADYFAVGPDYFKTMQIPLIRGREFSGSDNANAPVVAIVNSEFARRFFPKGDAIGQQIESDTGHHKRAQIVGIIGNVTDYPGQSAPSLQFYECYLQMPFPDMSVVLRSRLAPSVLAPMLRQTVWSMDKNQPIASILTMKDLANQGEGGSKLMIALMGIFAGLALILATVGIYGVIAYSVAQRTHEIGIRIALGAQKKDVFGLVLRQGGLLAGIGCGAGVLLALPLPRVFAAMFDGFGFAPQSPLLPVGVALVVAIVSVLATYIPARRATKVDPMVALRHE
jgi:predicted permease